MGSEQFSDDVELDDAQEGIEVVKNAIGFWIFVAGLLSLISFMIVVFISGAAEHASKVTQEDLAIKVHQSSIELEWSSPVRIENVFVYDLNGPRFMCDTSKGDGNSMPYYTGDRSGRIPRVGEWWKLAINAQGEKYLYTIDFEKMKKEGINIHE